MQKSGRPVGQTIVEVEMANGCAHTVAWGFDPPIYTVFNHACRPHSNCGRMLFQRHQRSLLACLPSRLHGRNLYLSIFT